MRTVRSKRLAARLSLSIALLASSFSERVTLSMILKRVCVATSDQRMVLFVVDVGASDVVVLLTGQSIVIFPTQRTASNHPV